MEKQEQLEVNYIDPAVILADDNARYGLKETRVETMMESIKAQGGVRTPLKISELPKPEGGKLYRVNEGHYRLEAAMRLKTGDTAYKDMEIPVEVEPTPDALVRLKHQLSENIDRENLTPMDSAVAIKRLMEAGVARMEIRNIFKRPGGRKGMKNQPVSNSFLNIHLQLLEFPRNIQEKIHDGRITLTGAMELAKKPKDQWGAIVEALEEDRLAEITAEENAEAKLLKEEAKIVEAQTKKEVAEKEAETAITEVDKAREKVQAAELAIKTHKDAGMDAYKARHASKDKAEKERLQKVFDEQEKAVKAAEKEADAARKEVAKQETAAAKKKEAAEKAAKAAADKEAELRAARELKKAKKVEPKAGTKEVKKAAARVGGKKEGPIELKLKDLRDLLADISKCGYPKVKAMGAILVQASNGVHTPTQCIKLMATVSGEVAAPKKEK